MKINHWVKKIFCFIAGIIVLADIAFFIYAAVTGLTVPIYVIIPNIILLLAVLTLTGLMIWLKVAKGEMPSEILKDLFWRE